VQLGSSTIVILLPSKFVGSTSDRRHSLRLKKPRMNELENKPWHADELMRMLNHPIRELAIKLRNRGTMVSALPAGFQGVPTLVTQSKNFRNSKGSLSPIAITAPPAVFWLLIEDKITSTL
jgi:hypothetical protein